MSVVESWHVFYTSTKTSATFVVSPNEASFVRKRDLYAVVALRRLMMEAT